MSTGGEFSINSINIVALWNLIENICFKGKFRQFVDDNEIYFYISMKDFIIWFVYFWYFRFDDKNDKSG